MCPFRRPVKSTKASRSEKSSGISATALSTALASCEAELRGWLAEVASALDFVHAQGFVHRDVKSGNLMVTRVDGRWGIQARSSFAP